MSAMPPRIRVSGLEWIDRLKGVAMLWVVLNHVVEQLAGGNLAGDPTGTWPPLGERISQWQPVHGYGAFSAPLTGLRDVGWLADQAVSIFIILSGFGLALGLLASQAGPKIAGPGFFGRRLRRIFPFWWGAHVLFLPAGLLFASGLSTGQWQFYASLAGLRFIPGVFYYFAGSWWYVGTIIQLYIAFPVLWWILRARGPLALLATTWGIGFFSLALGHVIFHGDLVEMWQRGICAVTRLPEFGFGMAFAFWWARDPGRGAALLRRPAVRLAAAGAYAAGFAGSFTLAGMTVAPTVLGIAAIVLLYPLIAWRAAGHGPLEFVGRHSFTIYLTHQYIVELLVDRATSPAGIALSIACALLATAVATFVLERGTSAVADLWESMYRRRGRAVAGIAFGGAALAVACSPLVAELALRSAARTQAGADGGPLRPDAAFGWRFSPSQTMALDGRPEYRVTSNAEGFPTPGLEQHKPKATLRVLVLGDAISSVAVHAAAWPRLLEHELARLHGSAQVANLSVSGYGPNQEAPVAQSFAPRFRPDVVLVEVYPDDVQDVLSDTDTMRNNLGVDEYPPNDLRSLLRLRRVHALLRAKISRPLRDFLRRTSPAAAFSLGSVYLERGHADWDGPAIRQSAERYREIASAARAVGARAILVFVPAPAQVCGPASFAVPQRVALADRSRYDVDLPDRRARAIAATARMELWDVSADLRAKFPCAFVPSGPYLRPEAEREIAALLAPRLLSLADAEP